MLSDKFDIIMIKYGILVFISVITLLFTFQYSFDPELKPSPSLNQFTKHNIMPLNG